ncbi:hypothetical protein N2152v2_005635 [Parachlorella kessleri]
MLAAAVAIAVYAALPLGTNAEGYLVYYSDANCSGSALTGLDAPWFGPNKLSKDMHSDESTPVVLTRLTANEGLSNTSSPLCADVELVTPCTQQFMVMRFGSELFIKPALSIWVADAPSCDISHCQGGFGDLSASETAGNGTFYDRLTGEPTFPFSIDTVATEEGTYVIAVAVKTPVPGLTCTLLYSTL